MTIIVTCNYVSIVYVTKELYDIGYRHDLMFCDVVWYL